MQRLIHIILRLSKNAQLRCCLGGTIVEFKECFYIELYHLLEGDQCQIRVAKHERASGEAMSLLLFSWPAREHSSFGAVEDSQTRKCTALYFGASVSEHWSI